MNNDNELYHYGVPGMRWGHRKKQTRTNNKSKKPKKKMSLGKKIAIGSAVTGVALVGIGKVLSSDMMQEKYRLIMSGKAVTENMW